MVTGSVCTLFIFYFTAINIENGKEIAIKLQHMNAIHDHLHNEWKYYGLMQGGGNVVSDLGKIDTNLDFYTLLC